jgi:hypothetical protein
MGTDIDNEEFGERDYSRFAERLAECLSALGQLLDRPGFGAGPATIGAELELFLIDGAARPLPHNQAIRAAAADPRVTLELNRFNLELNASPTLLAGRPFATLGGELNLLVDRVADAARDYGGRVALIGILPTLSPADLAPAMMTDVPRYRALDRGLRRLRQNPARIQIAGTDPLEMACDDVGLEAANTSFQVHLRVDPADFTRTYNAVQLATAPVLAVSGNSPTFLGHQLWEETRIALYKQSVDDRPGHGPHRRPARAALGTGWVRGGALELFTESIRLHQPLLPVLGHPGALADDAGPQTPPLDELRLHQGTVWRWNRGIYDPAKGGHLRIEMRALPAGPTIIDMLANAAFLIGAVPMAGRTRPAMDLRAAVRTRRSRLLPRRPARPVRPAELARRAPRPNADAARRQARGRAGTGSTTGPPPGRRGRCRSRRAARDHLRPARLGSDRRSMAARHPGRRRAPSRPAARARYHVRPLPPMRRHRAASAHLAHRPGTAGDVGMVTAGGPARLVRSVS